MTYSKPQVTIVNCQTNEVIIRDANADEIAQIKLDADNAKARQTQADANAKAKEELLTRLGITADEAKLLLA